MPPVGLVQGFCDRNPTTSGVVAARRSRDGDKTYDVVAQAESSQQSTPIYSNEKMGGGRIYCWIMTNPKNHETKAKTVKDTWGRHCEKLQFVTTEEHPDLDTLIVNLGEPESREKLWAKVGVLSACCGCRFVN